MSHTLTREGARAARGRRHGAAREAALRLARGGLPFALLYVVATALTDAHFMADTADYVESIVARGAGRDYRFWEFGHLLWRPLGRVCYVALRPFVAAFAGDDPAAGVTWTLMALSWLAGLASVLLCRAVAGRFARGRAWAANVAAVGFVFAQGFLNNAQTGSSYVPGLAFLLLGLYFLTGDAGGAAGVSDVEGGSGGRGGSEDAAQKTGAASGERRAGVAGGVALALSVCFWFPYVWAVPAALAAPLVLGGARGLTARARWRACAWAVAAGALTGAAAYGAALAALGIGDIAGVRAWVSDASHGNTSRGVTRAVFGLARSFVHMGNDGVLFKRYLLGDPFNPVSLWTLARLSLLKLSLFYLFLLATVAGLLRLRRAGDLRVLGLLAAGSLPIICFAVGFDGGAIERYLPLYPFVFVALAAALGSEGAPRPARWAICLFVAALVFVNGAAMLKPALALRQDAIAARVTDLRPRLGPHSLVYTVTWVDELVNFNRSFPFHPLNRGGGLRVFSLVTPGTDQVKQWREEFAARSLAAWAAGGEVWVSRRALAERPRGDWDWVEGDDRNVRWAEFREFFSRLEAGETAGGDDGFFLLRATPRNAQLLSPLAAGRRETAGRPAATEMTPTEANR